MRISCLGSVTWLVFVSEQKERLVFSQELSWKN